MRVSLRFEQQWTSSLLQLRATMYGSQRYNCLPSTISSFPPSRYHCLIRTILFVLPYVPWTHRLIPACFSEPVSPSLYHPHSASGCKQETPHAGTASRAYIAVYFRWDTCMYRVSVNTLPNHSQSASLEENRVDEVIPHVTLVSCYVEVDVVDVGAVAVFEVDDLLEYWS